ncbi:ESX secretion-associated protein EspG [Mycobacterium heidelbergense]|uniref:ESX secretion-associated protein EspG n=1 Tax=Mycobacterium heidelbergense TaxID=53376 RepID=UPI003CF3915C
MNTAELQMVGSISLLDLDIISKSYGRDFLPYPFMFTQPTRFTWEHEYVEYAQSVPERFNHGDLAMFQQCAGAYAYADIRVECQVQYIPADTPNVRVVACRLDQTGFLAKQKPDDDVIDVYELSPYLLGPAVAGAAELDKPGRHSGIVIPEYAGSCDNSAASEDVTLQETLEGEPSAASVPRAQVTAFATVQSHWRPTRRWGLDRAKNYGVWVRIKDDGEYLYTPDFSVARPVTPSALAERIDRLISEDVKALRQFRSG